MIQLAGASTFYRSKSSANESDIFGWSYAEYLIRGGRAVLIPIWKGSYERQDGFHPFESDRAVYREHVIAWVTELRQSIDYLESRKDINSSAIGFQGISFGAVWTPVFAALEPRLKTAILLLGGLLVTQSSRDPMPPELQVFNYAPRVKIPVLLMAGQYDPIFPYQTSQVPLFQTLGTDPANKKHLTYPSGHSTYGWRDQLDREGLEWLDKQFGPVAVAGAAN
jgi:dienelactone hydrolase